VKNKDLRKFSGEKAKIQEDSVVKKIDFRGFSGEKRRFEGIQW
jgi:hypothetical protein